VLAVINKIHWCVVVCAERNPHCYKLLHGRPSRLLITLYQSLIQKPDIGRKSRFLPRDAIIKRGLSRYAVSVRPSVCLSITFVDHVKTNKYIFEIFSPSGSHTILVFPYQTGCRFSDGNPPNWGVDCRWGRQKSRFWAYIWLHCLLLRLQQARCCQHGRRWTTATVSQVIAHRW